MPINPFTCFSDLRITYRPSVACQTSSSVDLCVNLQRKVKYFGVMINSLLKTTIDVKRQTRKNARLTY